MLLSCEMWQYSCVPRRSVEVAAKCLDIPAQALQQSLGQAMRALHASVAPTLALRQLGFDRLRSANMADNEGALPFFTDLTLRS